MLGQIGRGASVSSDFYLFIFSSINLSVGCTSVVCQDNFSTSICFDNCSCSDYILGLCLDRKRASAPGSILGKVTQVSLHDSS